MEVYGSADIFWKALIHSALQVGWVGESSLGGEIWIGDVHRSGHLSSKMFLWNFDVFYNRIFKGNFKNLSKYVPD